MKEKTVKQLLPNVENGKHTFLFWLIIPLLLVWLSFGYVRGLVEENGLTLFAEDKSATTNSIVPYFQEHGSFAVDLDQPLITIWMDDAWLSQYLVGFSLMQKYGLPGTMAAPVNAVGTKNYMNWAQLRTMQEAGWEITNHSLAHDCEMGSWEQERVQFELMNSKYILWKNGLTSDIFVTPCGSDSHAMREEARKMFMAYRTVEPGFNDPHNIDFYNLKVKNVMDTTTASEMKGWIDEAREDKSWLIFVFHKLNEESIMPGDDLYNTTREDFEEVLRYIRSTDVTVVLPSQMLASQGL